MTTQYIKVSKCSQVCNLERYKVSKGNDLIYSNTSLSIHRKTNDLSYALRFKVMYVSFNYCYSFKEIQKHLTHSCETNTSLLSNNEHVSVIMDVNYVTTVSGYRKPAHS